MRCNGQMAANNTAIANSSSGDPWQVFADTNCVWNAERLRLGDTVKGEVYMGRALSKHDIVIQFGNHATYNRFKVAVECQDASNIRAIARELVKVTDAAATVLANVASDPAVILVINKLDSMVNGSGEHFAEAYAFCKEWSGSNATQNHTGSLVRAIAKEADEHTERPPLGSLPWYTAS